MWYIRITLNSLFILIILTIYSIQAQTVEFQQGLHGYSGCTDSYVDSHAGYTTAGDEIHIQIERHHYLNG